MPTENKSIPKYVVLEKSLIGNELHEAGAVVEYDGLPAENLQPTCDEGRARYQEYLKSNAERVAKLKEQYTESAVGDPSKFAADFAKALAAQQVEHQAQMAALVEQNQAMAAMFTDAVTKLAGALQNIAAQAPAAPAGDVVQPDPAAATGTDASTKPAAKGRATADKSAGDGLV
jgi:hypothetical protein